MHPWGENGILYLSQFCILEKKETNRTLKDLAKLLLSREADLFKANRGELEAYENELGSSLSAKAKKTKILLDDVVKSYKKSLL